MTHPRWLSPFIPLAVVFPLLACIFPLFGPLSVLPTTGTLDVTINYDDDFYVDTFNYTRDAPNIHHFVLVMPQSEAANVAAHHVFQRLAFPPSEGEADELGWTLAYLHEAPQGYFTGEFEPGTYQLAVVFLAEPLSREDAGVDDDVILWPGVTGGGASTEFQTIIIEPGQTTSLTIEMTDANGWACPWLYVFDGHNFQRRTEILRQLNSQANETTEITPLGSLPVVDGSIVIKIAEEKAEVTYIDQLYLLIDGVPVPAAEADSAVAAQVAAADGNYLTLHEGEARQFRFPVSASANHASVSVVAVGYYIPIE